jgi:ribosomal protein S18 acetylase RimI-like enzyme
MRRVRLIEPDLGQVLDFCARDPIERVFLEDVARRGLGRFRAVSLADGSLRALCHVGANVVPAGSGCGDFADAVRAGSTRARMMIGEERAVDELWEAVSGDLPAPRDDRRGQPVYAIHEPPEPGRSGLRPARPADYELLLPACAAAHREELGIDPLDRDGDSFRWRTRAQIEDGRSWLWEEEGRILFKAEASAWTPEAAQIQQVWVDPGVRNRGYAQRGMRDLCRLLLARVPAVTLFVRPENAPALRVYEGIGMHRTISYRSLIF